MTSPPFGTTVPGNRYDLACAPARHPQSVTVVVTHFEQPAQLARTLTALGRQSVAPTQVVVADDGSRTRPDSRDLGDCWDAGTIEIVSQEDRGFRAAAARNLGAARARGDLLIFLDADTTPEPLFVERLTALPAQLPELLAVGRRRHARLEGLPTAHPVEEHGPDRALDDPRWLVEAYRGSGDLLRADERSHRFVISAVLACSRWWFEELGGFDETFTAYGGEDWELAHRSWLQGGLVAHVPTAVAWHDGPDAAERRTEVGDAAGGGDGGDQATRETCAVAARVGAPGAAYRGLLLGVPDILVTAAPGLGRRELSITLDSLLAAAPRCRIRLVAEQASWFAGDPRVDTTDPGPEGFPDGEPDGELDGELNGELNVGTAARFAPRLHLHLADGVLGPASSWARVLTALDGQADLATLDVTGPQGHTLATLRDLRLHRRAARWGRPDLLSSSTLRAALRPVRDVSLQAWLGGWA